MNERAEHLLTALAAKLGTTVESMWAVLIKQASITGTMYVMLCVLLIAGIGFYVGVVQQYMKKKDTLDEFEKDRWQPPLYAGLFLSVMASMFLMFSIHDAATALLNPEYFALKKLLGALQSIK